MGLVPLPTDDEVVKAWREHGKNSSATARALGVNESTIRKVLLRNGYKPRQYKRLPLQGAQLYGAYLKEGGDCHSVGRLARRFGVKPQSVRAAMRRYLDRVDPIN
jgi:transposase-like protein